MPSTTLRRLALAGGSLLLVAGAPAGASAKNGPRITSFPVAAAWSIAAPGLSPAGSNDWNCRPTAAHPRPVVLLHGTFANQFNSFAALAPAIRRQGSCVFSLDYGKGLLKGINGTKSIRSSAREVRTFVDRVLATTGARQVDLVGYSQGGVVARAYLRWEGGADASDPSRNKVRSLVGLSAPNHGTELAGLRSQLEQYRLVPLLRAMAGDAAGDLLAGSAVLTELNAPLGGEAGAGGETMPGVAYTMIATQTDVISVPKEQAFLTAGPGATVRNIPLQEGCPLDLSDHFSIAYSPRATAYVLKALDPSFGGRVPCTSRLPVV